MLKLHQQLKVRASSNTKGTYQLVIIDMSLLLDWLIFKVKALFSNFVAFGEIKRGLTLLSR